MKKLLVMIMLLCVALFLFGCEAEKTPLEQVMDRVSYREISKLCGQNDNFFVEITRIDGERDEVGDGKIGMMNKRTIIKLKPKNLDSKCDNYKIALKDKDNKAELTLEKDLLGLSYSASVSDDIYNFNASEMSILTEEKSCDIKLVDVLQDASVNDDKAIELAFAELKPALSDYFENNKYSGEVFVKLIHNNRVIDSPYYFYVSFIKNKDEFQACLINPVDGKIVNKKVNPSL